MSDGQARGHPTQVTLLKKWHKPHELDLLNRF